MIEPQIDSDFNSDSEITLVNLGRILILGSVLMLIHLVLIAVDILGKSLWVEKPGYLYLFYLHLLMILGMGSLLLTGLFLRKSSSKRIGILHRAVCLSTGILVTVWGALVSTADQFIHGEITVFLLTGLGIAVSIYYSLSESVAVFGLAAVVFLAGMFGFVQNPDKLQGHIINGSALTLISFTLSRLLYRARKRDIANRVTIENQKNELTQHMHEIQEQQKRIEMELSIAAQVQEFMEPDPDALGGLDFALYTKPSSEVSGDLHDFGRFNENEFFFLIADMAGHGVPAALLGAITRNSLGRLDLSSMGSGEVLLSLSQSLAPVSKYLFATAIYARINQKNRTIIYSNGAHVPGILLSPSGQVTLMEPTGSLLGLDESRVFDEIQISFEPGTRLALYTDCLVESHRGESSSLDMEGVVEILRASMNRPPREAMDDIVNRLIGIAGKKDFPDDLTIILADLK